MPTYHITKDIDLRIDRRGAGDIVDNGRWSDERLMTPIDDIIYMTKVKDSAIMTKRDRPVQTDEIEITPSMVLAGVEILEGPCSETPPFLSVQEVYRAMVRTARKEGKSEQVAT